MVWGGVSFWRSLTRLDLIDELRVDLHPYVAGDGTRLFEDVPKNYRLDWSPAPSSVAGPSDCSTAGSAKPTAGLQTSGKQAGATTCPRGPSWSGTPSLVAPSGGREGDMSPSR